jgi:ribonuclease D
VSETSQEETAERAEVPILDTPADGVPGVIDSPAGLAEAIDALSHGTGPVAVDTERAHGFRYSPKAYLIQLRRAGAGTRLIDPTAFEAGEPRANLSELGRGLSDAEWILHAASQDLPCLAEVGLAPTRLFDTELAARLLNLPRVNLGDLTESALGVRLLKEHSAADWSRRPLPPEWLTYAALDVERLDDLEAWLIERLEQAGKLEWAHQEFDHLVATGGSRNPPLSDPWRRTSGLHSVHSPLGMGVVRALWYARDALAAGEDRSPGRILNDRAISELAHRVETTRAVPDRAALRAVPGFSMRRAVRYEATWVAAVREALALPRAELPTRQAEFSGVPTPRTWEARWPDSYARWQRVRPALAEVAARVDVPVENLLAPEAVRRLLWNSAATTDAADVAARLAALGARPWQVELSVPAILAAWGG